jgi:hypothetical protein
VYKKWTPGTKDTQFLPPLAEGAALSQKFISECNGFTEFRVWVNAGGSPKDGMTEFILRDITDQTILGQEALADGLLFDEGWYLLKFVPDWASAGKTYQLDVSNKDSSASPGMKLAFYNTTSVSTIGELRLDGQLTDGTIIFQYGCITGLDKAWWQVSHNRGANK